jgi:hypothetical protein
MHILKIFWDTMGCAEKHRDLSEGAREGMGDIERYWDITKGVRVVMENKERSCNIIKWGTLQNYFE